MKKEKKTLDGTFTLLVRTTIAMLLLAGAALAQPAPAVDTGIPPNLVASPLLRSVLETMWHRSPTFKAQCARLRGDPSVLVELRFGSRSQVGGGRARTHFVQWQGRTARADIYIGAGVRPFVELVELIAHEVEHVIEQLDGVELTAPAQRGIRRTARGMFETARATHIGRTVAAEVDGETNSARR